jgi:outer membrane protein, multidrug efflux system
MKAEVRRQKVGVRRRAAVAVALGLLAGLRRRSGLRKAGAGPALGLPCRRILDQRSVSADSLGNLEWWQVMKDPQLQAYIAEALTNSWDIQIAAARVLQAEATARITRSQFFPTVGAGADWATTRASEDGASTIPPGVNPQREYGSVYGTMASYEVDLWGRIRRANEAALAQLLATEAAQQTVRQTLVAQVATAYLGLLELDYELEIAEALTVPGPTR